MEEMTIFKVYIWFALTCLLNTVCGQLVITSSAFECGKTGSIVCSNTTHNVKRIRWYINGNPGQYCSPNRCQFPSDGSDQYSANDGVWTLTKGQVERNDNNNTYSCEAYNSEDDLLSRVTRTVTVSVLIDNSSNLTTYENDTDTMFTAESNCIKPIENVRITMQCVLASDENVIVPYCRPTTPSTYISECNDLNETCAGPGTYRKRSVVTLATYRGNYFKSVKIKAIFTDGTNIIEKISDETKQEIPPKIAPLRDCSIIENSDFSVNCNLSSGDPSTVKCKWTAPSGTISNDCTLPIPRVQRTSSGTYTCRVDNSVGGDTLSFYLDIMYPPEKPVLKIVDRDITDLTANVLKDTPVTVRCSSSAKPNISFTWEPANGSVGSQLQITDTSSPFTRTYTCTVTNYMNETCGGNREQGSNSSKVNVHIVYPPEVQTVRFNGSDNIINISGSISVIRGHTFTLTCSAKSNPASTYRWDKPPHDGGLLSINNIDFDQSHTCTASNEMTLYNGSSFVGESKLTVNITVLYPPSIQPMGRQRIIEGSNFSQTCNTTPGRPIDTNYTWTRRKGGFSENERVLTITNVSLEFEDDYTCSVWNDLNPSYGTPSKGTDTQTFTLEILFPPKLKNIPNQSVMEGSSFTQTCEFLRRGNPPGKIMWFSLDQAGNEIQIGSVNGPLTFENVSRNHQGSFKCVTENVMEPTDREMVNGKDFKMFYLNVFYKTAISSLTIDDTEDRLVVNQNKANILFKCNVSSNPLSQISLHSTTHSGARVLQENPSSDHLLYSLSTATCWDSGVYTCYGRNNVTENKVSKAVILLVKCTARPLHETEQNLTFYKGVGDDVTLNLTVVAYPLPASELFQWSRLEKEDSAIHLNGSIVNISETSLESSLTLKHIREVDFGQYKLTIKFNDTMDAYVQDFLINAQDRPQVPENFVHLDEQLTTTTAVLKWTPGFDGGVPQVFNILYKKASDSTWSHIIVSSPPVKLTGLDPSTLYNVYMFASNEVGNSSYTTTLNITTQQDESQSSNIGAIIGGAAGGGAAIVVIAVVVVVVVIFRRRAAAKSRNSSDQIGENLYPESVDDGHDGMEFNPAYVSTDTLTAAVASGSDNVYAQVDKTKKKAAVNTDNTYAVVDKTSRKGDKATGQGDVYATPLKKKPGKKTDANSKQKGKKTKKDKAVKQKGRGDVYENVQEMNVYGNIGQKDDTTGENVYENREEPPVFKRNLNKDGLIYADLAFENNNRGHKKLVIHGSENQTDYVQVDFSKKAERLPDSDEEGDIA